MEQRVHFLNSLGAAQRGIVEKAPKHHRNSAPSLTCSITSHPELMFEESVSFSNVQCNWLSFETGVKLRKALSPLLLSSETIHQTSTSFGEFSLQFCHIVPQNPPSILSPLSSHHRPTKDGHPMLSLVEKRWGFEEEEGLLSLYNTQVDSGGQTLQLFFQNFGGLDLDPDWLAVLDVFAFVEQFPDVESAFAAWNLLYAEKNYFSTSNVFFEALLFHFIS